MSLAVTIGPDGQATLNYLAGGDQLVAVRLTAASIGTQDMQLLANPRRDNQGATITIRLKPTRRLAGRVRNRAGQPVAGQEVEVWSKGGNYLRMNPVRFQDGPLRTAADGSFRTPDNLLVGSSYQVVIRAPGFEPIMSKWITIGEQAPLLMPMLQRPLRTIRGRVVDRQGKPLSHVEVFQSGDGPERTATKTDGDGRFALGGFREGPVFLFARREGFRFFGRLIKPGEEEIAVELIRVGEHPTQELRTLPEPIPRGGIARPGAAVDRAVLGSGRGSEGPGRRLSCAGMSRGGRSPRCLAEAGDRGHRDFTQGRADQASGGSGSGPD